MASLFLLVYRLRAHRFGAWTLMRWAATVTLGVSATILVQWLLRGQSRLPAWYWLVLGLLLAVGVGLPAFGAWAARRGYVIFWPELGLAAPAADHWRPRTRFNCTPPAGLK